MPTTELRAAVDSLAAVDPSQMSDGETVRALYRELELLSAVTTRAVAAFDAGKAWEGDGARSASAWLAVRCRIPAVAARRQVRLGRALRRMPASEAAWLAGDIGEAHVALLAAARTPATEACFDRDEAMLAEQACLLRYSHFARCLAYWRQLATRTGRRMTPRPSTGPAGSTCRRPAAGAGSWTPSWIRSAGPSCPAR